MKRKGRNTKSSKSSQDEPELEKKVKREKKDTKEEHAENIQKHKKTVEKIEIVSTQDNISLEIGNRKYNFDLKEKAVSEDKQLMDTLNNLQKYEKLLKQKSGQKIEDILKITDHYQFSALEYYLFKALENVDRKKNNIKKLIEEENCCICQCELYDKIDDFKEKDIEEQLSQEGEDDCVGMTQCGGHFFHKNCLLNCVERKHIKCPICSRIYGIMEGDQPDGVMDHRIIKQKCAGFNDKTIQIEYSFPSGKKKDGSYYDGTYRVAYLPDNKEGRECLELLKIAFERKLIFTVGTSVTTGQQNTTIWNGVHHKTNLHGGSSHFGYPDPTYFNRLKLELAMKGIYADEI